MTRGNLQTIMPAIVWMSATCCCAEERTLAELKQLVAKIRNDDVRWHYGTFGVSIETIGATGELDAANDERAVPLLVDALRDDNRFAAAYLALVRITDIRLRAGLKYGMGEIRTLGWDDTKEYPGPGVPQSYDAAIKDTLYPQGRRLRRLF
jgi:hypothetical protein